MVALLVALSTTHAIAAVTVDPALVNVGDLLIGVQGSGTVVLNGDNEDVDLELDPNCTGGTFALSAYSLNNLNSETAVTAYFTPNARGISSCSVRIELRNTNTLLNSFTIRGNGQLPATISVADPASFGGVRYRDGTPYSFSQRIVRVTNIGDRNLAITGVAASSTEYTFVAQTPTIGPSQSHDWLVTFNPVAPAGARPATMTFTSNDPVTGTRTINLTGTATTAGIDVAPAAIAFGTVPVPSSKSINATIANNAPAGATRGQLTVTGATIAVTGGVASPSFFSVGGCTASCTFASPITVVDTPALPAIQCTPPAGTASQSARITFTSDADTGAATFVDVSCTAGLSDLSTDPVTVDFGPMLVGTTQTKTLTVFNNGTSPANVTLSPSNNGSYSDQFDVTGTSMSLTCGKPSPQGTCPVAAKSGETPGAFTVTITARPTREGPLSEGIDVRPPPPAGAPSFSISARGVDRHLDVQPAIEFPATYRNPFDDPAIRILPVSNIGEYPMLVTSITLEDGDPNVWSLAQPFEPFTVEPLSTTPVEVKFTPVISDDKPVMATLRIETDATDQRLVPGEPGVGLVTLSGVGKYRNVDMVPGSIDIGDTFAGIPIRLSVTRPGDIITVVNQDLKMFNIRDIAIENDDAGVFRLVDLEGNAFSAGEIAPGEMRQYDVMFTPSYPGAFEATIALYLDQDPVAQKPVTIRGNAQYVNAHGAGGCSTGSGSGSGVLVMLGFAIVAWRRRR